MKNSPLAIIKDGINFCLWCATANDPKHKKPLRMGLCPKDFQRFNRERNKLRKISADLVVQYEDELIQKGLLLPPKKPGPAVGDNPFAEIAQKFIDAQADTITNAAQQHSENQKKKG